MSGVQQQYTELSRGVLQAMYPRSPRADLDGFLEAVDTSSGDVVLMEPKLLEDVYDELLPEIDRAIGDRRRKDQVRADAVGRPSSDCAWRATRSRHARVASATA